MKIRRVPNDTEVQSQDKPPVKEPPNEPKKPPVEEPGESPVPPLPPGYPPVQEPPNETDEPPVKEPPPEDPDREPPHGPNIRTMADKRFAGIKGGVNLICTASGMYMT